MKYRVRFLSLAKQDLAEIKNYLDHEVPSGIRKAFDEQFEKQLNATEDYPDINPVYPGNSQYRRLVVRNYPYCVYYKVDNSGKTIDIYRVLHTSRDIGQLMPQEKKYRSG